MAQVHVHVQPEHAGLERPAAITHARTTCTCTCVARWPHVTHVPVCEHHYCDCSTSCAKRTLLLDRRGSPATDPSRAGTHPTATVNDARVDVCGPLSSVVRRCKASARSHSKTVAVSPTLGRGQTQLLAGARWHARCARVGRRAAPKIKLASGPDPGVRAGRAASDGLPISPPGSGPEDLSPADGARHGNQRSSG